MRVGRVPLGRCRQVHLLAHQRALLIWGLGGFHRVRSPGGEGVGRQKIERSRKTVSNGSVGSEAFASGKSKADFAK